MDSSEIVLTSILEFLSSDETGVRVDTGANMIRPRKFSDHDLWLSKFKPFFTVKKYSCCILSERQKTATATAKDIIINYDLSCLPVVPVLRMLSAQHLNVDLIDA